MINAQETPELYRTEIAKQQYNEQGKTFILDAFTGTLACTDQLLNVPKPNLARTLNLINPLIKITTRRKVI